MSEPLFEKFSDFFKKKDNGPPKTPSRHHIEEFHRLRAEMDHHARILHSRGYHIDIAYKNHHVARHGRDGQGSNLDYNQHLISKKRVTISKSALEHNESPNNYPH